VTGEEERIRELVELISLANGTHEVLALAEELKHLVEARKRRLRLLQSASPRTKLRALGDRIAQAWREKLC